VFALGAVIYETATGRQAFGGASKAGGDLFSDQFGARFAQIFGSGGPRAIQLGARLSF
jgi:hypothetical protein